MAIPRTLLPVAVFALLLSAQSFAYVIVLKDGTRYNAKAKWTVSNGKAIATLDSGAVVTLNPSEIDVAKTDQVNALGMGNVAVLGQEQTAQPAAQQQAPTLGQMVKMRGRQSAAPTGAGTGTPSHNPNAMAPAQPSPVPDQLDPQLKDKFERAYENVGIFEHKLSGTNRSMRVELTVDSEEKVFNAISATAFLIARNAGMDNMNIEIVDLFMKTTTGGAAGRFQMNRADADSINNKAILLPDYFVRKVIY